MYHVRITTHKAVLVLPAFANRADAIRMASYLALALRGRAAITFTKEA